MWLLLKRSLARVILVLGVLAVAAVGYDAVAVNCPSPAIVLSCTNDPCTYTIDPSDVGAGSGAALAGSHIVLGLPGTYILSASAVLSGSATTCIEGGSGATPGSYILKVGEADYHLQVQDSATLSLQGLKVAGDMAGNKGGILVTSQATLLTKNVHYHTNPRPLFASDCDGAVLELYNTNFTYNGQPNPSAYNYGGALYAYLSEAFLAKKSTARGVDIHFLGDVRSVQAQTRVALQLSLCSHICLRRPTDQASNAG